MPRIRKGPYDWTPDPPSPTDLEGAKTKTKPDRKPSEAYAQAIPKRQLGTIATEPSEKEWTEALKKQRRLAGRAKRAEERKRRQEIKRLKLGRDGGSAVEDSIDEEEKEKKVRRAARRKARLERERVGLMDEEKRKLRKGRKKRRMERNAEKRVKEKAERITGGGGEGEDKKYRIFLSSETAPGGAGEDLNAPSGSESGGGEGQQKGNGGESGNQGDESDPSDHSSSGSDSAHSSGSSGSHFDRSSDEDYSDDDSDASHSTDTDSEEYTEINASYGNEDEDDGDNDSNTGEGDGDRDGAAESSEGGQNPEAIDGIDEPEDTRVSESDNAPSIDPSFDPSESDLDSDPDPDPEADPDSEIADDSTDFDNTETVYPNLAGTRPCGAPRVKNPNMACKQKLRDHSGMAPFGCSHHLDFIPEEVREARENAKLESDRRREDRARRRRR